MSEKPFCGFPYGFHEFASLPEMPEDECCVHCGRPRHEIEAIEPELSEGIMKRHEEEKKEENGWVSCPQQDNRKKPTRYCETCNDRYKCQVYQEYLFNQS
jgi:hypothetical protein